MNSTSPEGRFGLKPFFAGSRKHKQTIVVPKDELINRLRAGNYLTNIFFLYTLFS